MENKFKLGVQKSPLENKMQKFYFTFGQTHENKGKYIIIEATSADLARKKMFDLFSNKWDDQYSEEEWFEGGISQAKKCNYKLLKVIS